MTPNRMTHCPFGGGIKKIFLLGLILSLVALLSVVDLGNYNRDESASGGGGLGLRHLSNIPSLKRFIPDHGISTSGQSESRTSAEPSGPDSRAIENYVPYDAFFVAANWTVFDVRRRKNTHRGLQNLNYTRAEFPELQVASTRPKTNVRRT